MPAEPWMTAMKADPVPWLLEDDNPPVRYLTLTQLLGRSAEEPEVLEARQAVWAFGPVQRLLAAVEAGPWDLDVLARFGVPGGHPALRQACERWLARDVWRPADVRARRAQPPTICYLGQLVGGLVRYWDLDDPRLQAWVAALARSQRFDDGNRPGGDARYGARSCLGKHSCFSGCARALWALAGIPEARRTPEVHEALRRGADFLLLHRLYRANHHRFRPVKTAWTRLHLPFALGWRTDVLDLLDVATMLGLGDDPSAADAVQYVLSKQNDRGRWVLEEHVTNYPGLLAAVVGDVEEPGGDSKWVTLTALRLLKCCTSLVERIARGQSVEQPLPAPQPTFAGYGAPYEAADEAAVRAEWADLGMADVLEALLAFARRQKLGAGWHWGLAIGPRHCPEWCAASARWVPARSVRDRWPAARVLFLAPRGCFAPEALAERLGLPLRDTYPGKRKPGNWLDATLWRVRVDAWSDEYDEVGLTVREGDEIGRLTDVLAEALASLRKPG